MEQVSLIYIDTGLLLFAHLWTWSKVNPIVYTGRHFFKVEDWLLEIGFSSPFFSLFLSPAAAGCGNVGKLL